VDVEWNLVEQDGWCHDTQHNDIQHNDAQHKGLICDAHYHYAEYDHAERRV